MKTLILGLVAVAVMSVMGVATSLSAEEVSQSEIEEALTVPEEIVFEGRLGKVPFDHTQHVEWVNNCDLCHHIGGYQSCEDCHDGSDSAIPRKNNALHMQCKGCHKQEGLDTGCNTCHIK